MNLKGLNQLDADGLRQWLDEKAAHYGLDLAETFLLRISVGRIAANEHRAQANNTLEMGWWNLFPTDHQLDHIVDWLIADLRDGAPWLGNMDADGRPKKLLKCRNYTDLMREADKAMNRRNAQQAKALGATDEEVIAQLADGYSVVEMLTPEALDLESLRMHHCVGHGSYDKKLKSGWSRFLSLRDSKRRPVVTIELRQEMNARWSIQQIQGKNNARPAREIMDVIRDYAIDQDWLDREFFWPVARASDGIFHDVDRIPAGVTLRGDLDVGDAVFDALGSFDLPTDLTVEGNMLISARMMLPERLTVCGYLEVDSMWADMGAPLELPESLHVDSEIWIGSRSYISDVIPTHLYHLVRVHRPKLVVRDGGPHRWEEDVRGLDDNPVTPRM